jgi:hypothetical protein
MLVGGYKADIVSDSLSDETIERSGIGILDNLADNIPLAADSSDNAYFAALFSTANMSLFASVAVLIFSTDERFINLDNTHKLTKFGIMHRCAQSMTGIPCCASRRSLTEELSSDLSRGHTFLARQHHVKHFEPSNQWNLGILENGSSGHREPIGVALPALRVGAFPFERLRTERINMVDRGTPRALNAIGPTALNEIFSARFVGLKGCHELCEGHHG